MKIGLVRRGYSASGGAEAYLLRLAAELAAKGHEPVLFSDTLWPDAARARCTPPLTLCYLEKQTTASNWPLRITPAGFAGWLRVELKNRALDFVLSLERVWECDVYRAGDGVHAAWLERRRQFEPAWRAWFRGFQRKHREILKLERALFTGGARHVIANSQMVKDEIIRHFGTAAERVHVIHNGVPVCAVAPGARENARRELGLAPAEFVALFAGTGWKRKGLRHAIEAVNALKNPATLLVAGRGGKSGLPSSGRVKFLGPLAEERMRAVFAAADVFLLPTFYDPFSNACIEALAAGLPVITTTANGFAEIIEHGVEGDAVAPGDTRALAGALAAWADPVRREHIRARLVEKAAKYSVGQNVARTLEVITALS